MRRREFILSTVGAVIAPAALAKAQQAGGAAARPTVCYFSKYLTNLNYAELGKALRDAGFDGVDLTVRPRGHVLPERVTEDLPRAVEAIRSHGLKVPMITTELTSAEHPAARPILSTAARLKIPYFKLGYWRYSDDVLASVRDAGAAVHGLTALAKEYGIVAGFHNHPRYVGLAFWDSRKFLRELDPKWIGYYYDPGNATQEGGEKGWEVGLRLASLRLKMAACDDFYWEKARGEWKARSCPLGEGMVHLPKVFELLAAARFTGLISLHQEYHPADRLAAAHEDLEFIKKQIEAAYGA